MKISRLFSAYRSKPIRSSQRPQQPKEGPKTTFSDDVELSREPKPRLNRHALILTALMSVTGLAKAASPFQASLAQDFQPQTELVVEKAAPSAEQIYTIPTDYLQNPGYPKIKKLKVGRSSHTGSGGAYLMTNQVDGKKVVVFDTDNNGKLTNNDAKDTQDMFSLLRGDIDFDNDGVTSQKEKERAKELKANSLTHNLEGLEDNLLEGLLALSGQDDLDQSGTVEDGESARAEAIRNTFDEDASNFIRFGNEDNMMSFQVKKAGQEETEEIIYRRLGAHMLFAQDIESADGAQPNREPRKKSMDEILKEQKELHEWEDARRRAEYRDAYIRLLMGGPHMRDH